ncbi:MAG TPA: secondary thiamine-phosphate synthase enzyme YjbQ [Syntrophomonadaceae bacterium]|nr:secondary thiamine-phosphate synthase enzyme YjbQ [Syntrophomonadaceae bacterium]
MKSYTEYLWFNTDKRREYIRITDKVKDALAKSGITEGMILVSAMHISAGVFVNDFESGILEDIDNMLEEIAPFGPDYKHHLTGEDNGDAHLKSILVHHQIIVPVTNKALDLGPWQEIFYAEFDGRRRKRVIIKVMGL